MSQGLARHAEGTTELMCHPGHCGEYLRAAHTRLKESREAELEALLSQEVREALEKTGIALVSYRDLNWRVNSFRTNSLHRIYEN
jgi:predicted glycoside hydrolase/deacetylase ChbG (UPF0249 family)